MSRSSEEGITIVELMVTMAMMMVIAGAALAVALRAFASTGVVTNRGQVYADGQVAMERVTKQLRQAESIDTTTTVEPTRVDFTSYINGVQTDISWRVTGSSAPYTLEYSKGSGYVEVLDDLASNSVFTLVENSDLVVDTVDIDLALDNGTTTVLIESEVHMRNVEAAS